MDGGARFQTRTEFARARAVVATPLLAQQSSRLSFVMPDLLRADMLPYLVRQRASSLYGWGPWLEVDVQPPSPPAHLDALVVSDTEVWLHVWPPLENRGSLPSKLTLGWGSRGRWGAQRQRVSLLPKDAAWRVIDHDTFEPGEGAIQWFPGRAYQGPHQRFVGACGDWGVVLGGHRLFGAHTRLSRRLVLPNSAGTTGIRLTFDFLFLDKWHPALVASAAVNEDKVWQGRWQKENPLYFEVFPFTAGSAKPNQCGQGDGDMKKHVEIWLPYSKSDLNLSFYLFDNTNNWLSVSSDTWSWAVDNVTVTVTDSAVDWIPVLEDPMTRLDRSNWDVPELWFAGNPPFSAAYL